MICKNYIPVCDSDSKNLLITINSWLFEEIRKNIYHKIIIDQANKLVAFVAWYIVTNLVIKYMKQNNWVVIKLQNVHLTMFNKVTKLKCVNSSLEMKKTHAVVETLISTILYGLFVNLPATPKESNYLNTLPKA